MKVDRALVAFADNVRSCVAALEDELFDRDAAPSLMEDVAQAHAAVRRVAKALGAVEEPPPVVAPPSS